MCQTQSVGAKVLFLLPYRIVWICCRNECASGSSLKLMVNFVDFFSLSTKKKTRVIYWCTYWIVPCHFGDGNTDTSKYTQYTCTIKNQSINPLTSNRLDTVRYECIWMYEWARAVVYSFGWNSDQNSSNI